MPEPIWFSFTLDALGLFVNVAWYESYVALNTRVPVIWKCVNVTIDKLHFTQQDPIVATVDTAKIKCVLACDHAAQHIIYEYTSDRERLSHADIHES